MNCEYSIRFRFKRKTVSEYGLQGMNGQKRERKGGRGFQRRAEDIEKS